MTEFIIDGRVYRARPFDADVHVSLMLKLAPTFSALMSIAPSLVAMRQSGEGRLDATMLGEMSGAVLPVSRELAALDRQGDARVIIDACMDAADQRVEGKWYPVRTKAGVVSNRDNATYAAKLWITLHVIRLNFAPMLSGMGLDLDGMMSGDAVGGV